MYFSAENYEIHFDPEHPEHLRIFDTITQTSLLVTKEEAMALLRLMLEHQDEIRLLRTGR
jgi:hypothetical protein